MRVVLLLILIFFALSACERRTNVVVRGQNPPTFELHGGGRLDEVLIFAPEQEAEAKLDPFSDKYAIWKIQAANGDESSKTPIETIGTITYGVVPTGYYQTKPQVGQPPSLNEGKRYKYWFVTINAPWGTGYFEIREGKAIAVAGP